MVAQPESKVAELPKRSVLSREEVLRFIPHGDRICGLDRAWYDEEESDTIFAQHCITLADCEGHFANERLRLLICPLFRILEWLGQLTCLNARLRFGVRAELGAFTDLSTTGLLCFLIPGDELVLVSKILKLEQSPNGRHGKGSASAEVWWRGFQVLSSCVFDFVAVDQRIAARFCEGREYRLQRQGANHNPAMIPSS